MMTKKVRNYQLDESKPLHKSRTTIIVCGYNIVTGDKVVVKQFYLSHMSPDKKERYERELKILKMLQVDEHVVRLMDHFVEEDVAYVVMEQVSTDLLTFFEGRNWKLPKKTLKSIARQLVEITQFLHERNVVHCDLKLENFLYDEKTGIVKVIDFGQSFILENKSSLLKGVCGTRRYVAPEVFLREKEGWNPYQCDVYALGVVLYALVYGRMPFSDKDGLDYYMKLRCEMAYDPKAPREDLAFYDYDHHSVEWAVLLQKMLSLTPAHRPCPAEVLKSPVFQKKQREGVVGFFKKMLTPFKDTHHHEKHAVNI